MSYKRISPQPVAEGGTGATTLTAHGVLLGEGASAITPTAVGTNGQVLLGSTGADPGWVTPTAGTGLSGTFNSTTHSYALSTPVSIANGGTNATSMATTDGVVYYDGTSLVTTSAGTSGQVLTSNGAGVAPTYQAAGGGGVLTASLTLTNAQIKALVTTPIQIIATPGSGNAINVISCAAWLIYGGTNAFTNTSANPIALFYNTNAANNLAVNAMDNNTITATATNYVLNGANTTTNQRWTSTIAVNTAMVVSLVTGSANIAGNAANNNTIRIVVTYVIVS